PDGRWEASIELDFRGHRQRKYLYGKTRGDVAQKLTKTLRDRDKGLDPMPERTTLGAYLPLWLTGRTKLRPTSRTRYAMAIDKHLVPELGHIRLGRLTPEHIEAYQDRLLAQGLSTSALHVHRAILSTALKQA